MLPVDYLWVLVCATLVMSMQVGFCMLEAGLVRSKNTINVALKNLMDFCVATVIFWAWSYAVLFGPTLGGLIGGQGFFLNGVAPEKLPYFVFQLMFCATAATIVSGAVAERMRFGSYLLVTALVSGLIYPIFGHWAWSQGGWLRNLGYVDFAGSGVVHGVGGAMALVAAIVLGPRKGRFDSKQGLSSSHSLTISTFGVLVLFVAWMGFNGGSTLKLNLEVPLILVNTVLSGCVGGLAALGMVWWREKLPRLPPTLNGCIGGLVGITASCHAVAPWEAAVIGAVAGVVSYEAGKWLEHWRVDDAVGASAAHFFPGVWALLAVALFGDPAKLQTGLGFWSQLGAQLVGVATLILWAGVGGWVALRLLNRMITLRIDEDGERVGLNVAEHGASTEIIDLLTEMSRHSGAGDFTRQIRFEPYTEVGQIAEEYNRVISKVVEEMELREGIAQRLRVEQAVTDQMNRKMLGSIEYAQRIQQAILPSPEYMQRLFTENFVIYRPRDLVSGDFYWVTQADDSILLAVADCTGHGVPGAFMSMIGYANLRQIVLERGMTEPAGVLAELHRRIRLALGQDKENSGNQDGMDIALIRIDPEAISFAGARRPLWILPAQGPLQTIRGDRKSIGGGRHETREHTLQQHRIPRTQAMRLYLGSDGLTDQPNHLREPYDSSRLESAILSSRSMSLLQQGSAIEQSLDLFCGGASQRDDITLLGIGLSEENPSPV